MGENGVNPKAIGAFHSQTATCPPQKLPTHPQPQPPLPLPLAAGWHGEGGQGACGHLGRSSALGEPGSSGPTSSAHYIQKGSTRLLQHRAEQPSRGGVVVGVSGRNGRRARQVGESQKVEERPEGPFGTEETRGCWNLNQDRLFKKSKIQTARFLQANGSRGQGSARRRAPARAALPAGGAERTCRPQHRGQRRPRPLAPLHLAPESLRAHSASPGAVSTADSAPRLPPQLSPVLGARLRRPPFL